MNVDFSKIDIASCKICKKSENIVLHVLIDELKTNLQKHFAKTLTRIHQMHTQRGFFIGGVGSTGIQHVFDIFIRITSEVFTGADNYTAY